MIRKSVERFSEKIMREQLTKSAVGFELRPSRSSEGLRRFSKIRKKPKRRPNLIAASERMLVVKIISAGPSGTSTSPPTAHPRRPTGVPAAGPQPRQPANQAAAAGREFRRAVSGAAGRPGAPRADTAVCRPAASKPESAAATVGPAGRQPVPAMARGLERRSRAAHPERGPARWQCWHGAGVRSPPAPDRWHPGLSPPARYSARRLPDRPAMTTVPGPERPRERFTQPPFRAPSADGGENRLEWSAECWRSRRACQPSRPASLPSCRRVTYR